MSSDNVRLEEMFSMQESLQNTYERDITSQQYCTDNILAALNELHEALRETPWKSWKKQQSLDAEKFKDELIDVWHFYLNLCLFIGMDSNEMYTRYLKKNKENFDRIVSGY